MIFQAAFFPLTSRSFFFCCLVPSPCLLLVSHLYLPTTHAVQYTSPPHSYPSSIGAAIKDSFRFVPSLCVSCLESNGGDQRLHTHTQTCTFPRLISGTPSNLRHHHTGLPKMASPQSLVPTAVELLRLAHSTLLRSPQQEQQGQPQAEAVAALRAHLAQDDAASLKQDLKALARLLEQAMLDGGEESGEDNASSSTTTTTTTARRLAAAFSETLNLTGARRKLAMPFSSSSPPPFAKDEKHAGAPAVHGAGVASPSLSPSCWAPPSNPLTTPSLLNEIFDYVGLISSSPSISLCISSSKSISLSSSSSSSSAAGAAAAAGAGGGMTPDMSAVMAARTSLGDLACVCRLWKATASEDRYWRPLSTAFLPMLGTAPTKTTTTIATKKPLAPGTPPSPPQLQSPCRNALVQYGKCLAMPTVRDGDDWQAHLLLSFEVIDERDSLRLFSASGPVDLILSSESGLTALRLTGVKRTEICRPFSAASRDPDKRRFKTIKDYFANGSQPQYPASLRVRVVGTDTRTGKQALLYSSHTGTQRSVKISTLQYWQQYLAADSLFVWEPWSRWSTGDGTQANEVVEISTSFYVSPVQAMRQGDDGGVGEDVGAGGEAGAGQQEGNPDPPQGAAAAPIVAGPAATALARERAREQLHVVMGGDEGAYASHNSFLALQFRTLDASVPARFIKAALAAADAATP